MRVIAGQAKGRILLGPKTNEIRPALDKIKGAIFNILQHIVEGSTVLDLFAGTGSVGIEALSRGACSAVFVDFGREALKLIQENVKRCNFENRATLIRMKLPDDVRNLFKNRHQIFDLIFVDPPYDKGLVTPTLKILSQEKILAPQGIVIVEHSPREKIATESGFEIFDERKYGQTLISFCRLPRVL